MKQSNQQAKTLQHSATKKYKEKKAPSPIAPYSFGFALFLLSLWLFFQAGEKAYAGSIEVESWLNEVIRPAFPWLCFAIVCLIWGLRIIYHVKEGDYQRKIVEHVVIPDWSNTPLQQRTNVTLIPENKIQDRFYSSFLGSLIVCGFLGIIWQFTPSAMMTIFLIPSLIWLLYSLSKISVLFAPSIIFVLHDAQLTSEGNHHSTIRWQVKRGAFAIKNLTIDLIGQEQVKFSRGSDTITETTIFYQKALTTFTHSTPIDSTGEFPINIPAQTMHTLHADYNSIVWLLRVTLQTSFNKKLEEDYELIVYPAI